MTGANPYDYIWWLSARAAGVVALGLVTASVGIGLLMATKLLRRPGLNRVLVKLHEHLALTGLVAIAVHGITLLGDSWLKPGVGGVMVPFAMSYRPLFTGLGIVAGYLAALLGLSFYARRRIGTRLWRKLHRATSAVYVLGVVHALGAGTDASTTWLRAFLLVTGAPIVFLLLVRFLPGGKREAERARPSRRRPAQVPASAMAEGQG